tara:strand:+ start:1534 stop:3342 length:1809 start_codon:yes stop_codon:yes gene_type:complete
MNKFIVAIVGSILFAFNTNISHAGWWDADFNVNTPRMSEDNGSGNWGKFWVHSNTPRHSFAVGVVGGGHPRRGGAQSFRFERRTGACQGTDCGWHSERTELGADGKSRPGDDRWYAWSIYHQNYKWLSGGVAPFHGQFKTMGENMPGRSGHQYVIFSMEDERGMVANFDAFDGWGKGTVIIPKNQINNKWNDIRVHAKWSTGADGIFQIWVNGVLKVNRKGRNMIDADPVAFRFGIYAPQINRAGDGRPTQVVYYDELMRGGSCQSVSQFMSCPGGGGGNNPPPNTGGKDADFVKYVNMWGDLKAAYNRNSGGKSKAEWGYWHYCKYGKKEGRKGLTPAHCTGGLKTNRPQINITVDESDRGDRFTSEITNGVKRFSKVAVFNSNVFSFNKDYHTLTGFEFKDNQGLLLGIPKFQDTDGSVIDPIGIGWRFDNVAFMVAQDNSMLGYKAEGIFDFRDPSTTYIDLGHRKKFSENVTLFTDVIYAFGRSKEGDLVKLSNVHALGFESKLEYKATDKNIFVFRFDMPLHIEKGTSRFYVQQLGKLYELNIDLEPDGREMQYNAMHNYKITKASNLVTQLNYTDDVNHRKGTDDYSIMVKYYIKF